MTFEDSLFQSLRVTTDEALLPIQEKKNKEKFKKTMMNEESMVTATSWRRRGVFWDGSEVKLIEII